MLNHVEIMGRFVHDPEVRYTQNNIPVASFTLAVDDDYAPKGAEKHTNFFNCVAWRQTAEFVKNYFGKGRMAVVTGSMQSRKYEDKNGNNRIAWEVIVDHIYFGDSKRSSDAESAPEAQQEDFSTIGDDDGELPFD